MNLHLDYPYSIDRLGRSARTTDEDHVRDLVEQVLFTVPGERLNRPDFGTGVMQLVFASPNDELMGAIGYSVQAALQQWLADVVTLDGVDVSVEEGLLRVAVAYTPLPHAAVPAAVTGALAGGAEAGAGAGPQGLGSASRVVVVERRTGP
ncbi:MAG TPA: GPW/gp25 family protein [Kineosporiaceae bacterium]